MVWLRGAKNIWTAIQETEDFEAEEDENTISLLNRYIDDSDFDCSKDIVKSILQRVYVEACEVE